MTEQIAKIQDVIQSLLFSSRDIDVEATRETIRAALPGSDLKLLPDGRLSYKRLMKDETVMLHEAIHQILITSASNAVRSGTPILQYSENGSGVPTIPRLLTFLRQVTDLKVVDKEKLPNAPILGLVDDGMVWRLIEDLLEMGTLDDSMDLFSYVDDLHLEFKGDVPNGIKLPLLRSCNGLLKRLSKAQDNQMCGRILMFMAKLYPLADKSGVNLHGNINMSLPLPIDEVADDAVDSCGQPIDAKLYTTLWNLQNVFKNPVQVANPTVWTKVRSDINAILDEFSKLPMTVIAGHSFASCNQGEDSGGAQPMRVPSSGTGGGGGAAVKGSGFNVKYLSSSKLFGLQLRDATFRRHFLVQCLILTHHMKCPSAKDKASFGAPDGLDDIRKKILEALQKTEEHGQDFTAAVEALLVHETAWVAWKNASCPPFERPPEPATVKVAESVTESALPQLTGKRRRGAASSAAASRQRYIRMVSVPVDQMAGLRTEERKLLPELREFLFPVIEDMDPENCIDNEYRRKNNKVFAWKCLRMLSRTNLGEFSNCKDDVEKAVLDVFPDLKEKFDAYAASKEEEAKRLEAEEKEGGGGDEEAKAAEVLVKKEEKKEEAGQKEEATADEKMEDAGGDGVEVKAEK